MGAFFQTQGKDENDQKPEGNSQTNTQVVVPTDDVPNDDVVVVGDKASSGDVIPLSDNSIEEDQQSNLQSHYK